MSKKRSEENERTPTSDGLQPIRRNYINGRLSRLRCQVWDTQSALVISWDHPAALEPYKQVQMAGRSTRSSRSCLDSEDTDGRWVTYIEAE